MTAVLDRPTSHTTLSPTAAAPGAVATPAGYDVVAEAEAILRSSTPEPARPSWPRRLGARLYAVVTALDGALWQTFTSDSLLMANQRQVVLRWPDGLPLRMNDGRRVRCCSDGPSDLAR